jgi:pimeloyl-ACP methyl ester carboxylesterase
MPGHPAETAPRRARATVDPVATDSDDPPRRIHCTTPDGLSLAAYDLGGTGADLLMVHATGFCAEMFGPLARALRGRLHCWGLDLRGHGRSERPADGDFAWSGFATDVLTAVDRLGLERPLGFGHSCGGAAVLLAEQARPSSFGALYCFEPVVFAAPPSGPSVDNPQSAGARRRRSTFDSVEDALANFSTKPPLDQLDPEVLSLYVSCGFESIPPAEGGDGRSVRLRCRREDEAEVFARAPEHDAFARLPEIACPVALCCGEYSETFGRTDLQADARRLRTASVEVLPGVGHFGPLEAPSAVAASVVRSISASDGTPRF